MLPLFIIPSKINHLFVFQGLRIRHGSFFSKGLVFQGNKNEIREYNVDKCHKKVCNSGLGAFLWL